MSQEHLQLDKLEMLAVGNGEQARKIAYLEKKGTSNQPGLFWLSGFKSSMIGQKATTIAEWAAQNGRSCCRMDYSGHGLSEGAFEDGTISDWLEEACAVFEEIANGPQIVVGSSMGGWMALLLADKMRVTDQIAGLVLIAPAWNMTRLIVKRLDDNAKRMLDEKGHFARPSRYEDGDYPITKKLIEDGENHLLDGRNLKLGCPVHILHGRKDPDIPWQHGHELTSLLPHDAVTFTLIPDGDHRLSRPEDLDLLIHAIENLDTG